MHEDSSRAVFINGLLVSHADGVSDPRERAVLWRFKEQAGISDAQAIAWYDQVRRGALGAQAVPRTVDSLTMLELLAEIALADGEVTDPERATIREIARVCGLSDYSVDEITKRIWQTGR